LGLGDLATLVANDAINLAGDVTLQAADGLELGVALTQALGDVGLGARIDAQPTDGDEMQGAICGAVTAVVEAVVSNFAGGGWDRAYATEGREARLRLQPLKLPYIRISPIRLES
jgi:hypothetical protein